VKHAVYTTYGTVSSMVNGCGCLICTGRVCECGHLEFAHGTVCFARENQKDCSCKKFRPV